jgi:hypothetical protein
VNPLGIFGLLLVILSIIMVVIFAAAGRNRPGTTIKGDPGLHAAPPSRGPGGGGRDAAAYIARAG